MKKILVTQRLGRTGKGELFESLATSWTRLFCSIGLLAQPVSCESDPRHLVNDPEIGGVLFSGGNDLSVVSDDPLSARRDTFERALLGAALEKNIPVFGVCRGMQFLAVFYESSIAAVSGHAGTRHAIRMKEKPPFWFVAPDSGDVNSYHNWGITACGPELAALATAPDGCVEAFAHRKLALGGIMWHPEREEPFKRSDVDMVKRFFSRSEKA